MWILLSPASVWLFLWLFTGRAKKCVPMCRLFPCTSHEMTDTVLRVVLWGFSFALSFNKREGALPVTAGASCTSPGYRCARVRCILAQTLGAGTCFWKLYRNYSCCLLSWVSNPWNIWGEKAAVKCPFSYICADRLKLRSVGSAEVWMCLISSSMCKSSVCCKHTVGGSWDGNCWISD